MVTRNVLPCTIAAWYIVPFIGNLVEITSLKVIHSRFKPNFPPYEREI